MPMHRISPNRRRRQRGSALVESGLTMIVFMTVIFGLIEFGRVVWAYNLMSHAVRGGRRYAMVHGKNSSHPATADGIKSVITSQAVGLDPAGLQINVSWIPNNKPGASVKGAARD